MRIVTIAQSICVAATLAMAQAPAGKVPPSYKDLKFPPLNQIKIPNVTRYTMANGMTVFLVEDHELPVVNARALIRTGDRWDPAGKNGLSDITANVMRTGGTPTRNGDDLDKELDRLGAGVEVGSGDDSASASVFVLKEDSVKGLSILADLLQNPAFPQEKIDLAKTTMRASISRRNDNASGIHHRETGRLLYGKDTAYGRRPEYATLSAIGRDDVITFHKQYYQPENVILAVWGDFQIAQMKQQLEGTFGKWARGGQPKPSVPEAPLSAQAKGIHLLKKDDVNQTNIAMGFLLGRADHPDHAALTVMTRILGGGFGSRMFNAVRTNAGLAYAASAGYSPELDHSGSLQAMVTTKSETTAQALDLMKREIAKMKEAEVTDAEMQRAKDALLKGEAFDFDSVGKVVGRLMTYEYFGYPENFFQKNREAIGKVTKADVLRVAKQYLVEDKFLTVVLGNPAKFDKALSSFGPVTDVDYSIPEPKAAPVAAATADTLQKGKDLLTKVRAAHGGDALMTAKDYQAKLDMTMVTPQGEMVFKSEATSSMQGKSAMKMLSPMGEITQVFDGANVWLKTPQGTREMPNQVAAARTSSARELISVLRNFDKAGYRVQSLGATKLDGKDVESVLVANDDLKLEVKLFVDPVTNLLAGRSYVGQAMMGPPGEVVESYSDIREVGGIKMPFRIVGMREGKRAAEQRMSEIKINVGVPDSAFAKP
ncbi:MAG: pitrilysin family protein [Bryobacteraceae bacterium]